MYCSSLTSIEIPNSVTSIGNSAFIYCSSLTSITIGNSVTTIGRNAFYRCDGLTEVHINDIAAWCNIDFEDAQTNPLYNAQNLYLDGNKVTDVIIPNSVTSIGDYAFIEYTDLKSVTIPNSVTSIGNRAFYGCEGLTSITIGSSVKTIGSSVFSNCYYITDIYCYAAIVPSTDITAFKNSYPEYVTLHVPAVAINRYKTIEPWSDFGTITALDGFSVNKYLLTYKVDGEIYANDSIEYGAVITPIAEPSKVGHTFSGWKNIPGIMPANDVVVEGTFSVNSYTLTYKVDGTVYKTETIAYGATITPIAAPTKEGHTFSGWSEIPETMPAKDIVVEGSFSVNSYLLTYKVDGDVYASDSIKYGATITPIAAPTKEGHTFSGWSEIPKTMPANDVVVEGTFSINSYTVSYMVDGEVYKSLTVKYGDSIPAVEVPTLDGYIFDSWDEIPSIMPAVDIIIESYWLIPGDVNNDGRISVLDITILTNHILRINDNSIFKQQAADMNSDGRISIVDVTKVTNKILE